MPESEWTRADFLKRASALGIFVAGGGALTERAFAARERYTTTAVQFLGWQTYDGLPSQQFPAVRAWEKSHGISINSAYIDNNPQIVSKLQASKGTYDIATPIHSLVPTLVQAGLVDSIQPSELSNWRSVFPAIKKLGYLHGANGSLNAVPLTFGYLVLPLYNPRLLQTPPKSWSELLSPQFRKKFALLDYPENLTWIAKTLGYGHPDPHHITLKELDRVKAFGVKVLKAARTLSASAGDLLQLFVSKEISFSPNAASLAQIDKAKAQGVPLKLFFTKEGSFCYVDNYCIARDAPNRAAALQWINEMISPAANAEVGTANGSATVNIHGPGHMPASLRKYYPFSTLGSFLSQKAPVYPPQPLSSKKYATYADWINAWTAVKQG